MGAVHATEERGVDIVEGRDTVVELEVAGARGAVLLCGVELGGVCYWRGVGRIEEGAPGHRGGGVEKELAMERGGCREMD